MTETENETKRRSEKSDFAVFLHNMCLDNNNNVNRALTMSKHMLNTFQ